MASSSVGGKVQFRVKTCGFTRSTNQRVHTRCETHCILHKSMSIALFWLPEQRPLTYVWTKRVAASSAKQSNCTDTKLVFSGRRTTLTEAHPSLRTDPL